MKWGCSKEIYKWIINIPAVGHDCGKQPCGLTFDGTLCPEAELLSGKVGTGLGFFKEKFMEKSKKECKRERRKSVQNQKIECKHTIHDEGASPQG